MKSSLQILPDIQCSFSPFPKQVDQPATEIQEKDFLDSNSTLLGNRGHGWDTQGLVLELMYNTFL